MNSAKEVWDTDPVQDSNISADAEVSTGVNGLKTTEETTGTDKNISTGESAKEGGKTGGIQVEEIRIGHDGETP